MYFVSISDYQLFKDISFFIQELPSESIYTNIHFIL